MDEFSSAGSRASSFRRDLQAWRPVRAAQQELRAEYLDFVTALGADAMRREAGRSHLTASCFVFAPDLSRILLCFHGKGRFWVQAGGHIEEGDATLADAAIREATEETGIAGLRLVSALPLDLDRHPLGAGFVACDVHWDVGFAAIAAGDDQPVTSSESEDVRWWPIDALPAGIPAGFADRLSGVVDAARLLSLRERGVAEALERGDLLGETAHREE